MKKSLLRKLLVASTLAAATLTTSLHAAPITGLDDIQLWYGTGTNRAGLVIDWNDGTHQDSFAWGYRWNGTATGEDMLRTVAGLSGTNTSSAIPDASGDAALVLFTIFYGGYGEAVFEFDYTTSTQTFAAGGFEDTSAGYWAYYNNDGSGAYPAALEWAFANVGMQDRQLTDGSWDAWSWAPDFAAEPASTAIAAVPGRSTIALILAAAFVAIATAARQRAKL